MRSALLHPSLNERWLASLGVGSPLPASATDQPVSPLAAVTLPPLAVLLQPFVARAAAVSSATGMGALMRQGSLPDAAPQLVELLADIVARRSRGERVIVAFDIDNTLMDSRHRTLAAVHAFGRKHQIPKLMRARLQDVGLDGESTWRRLGLPNHPLATALQKFWSDFFWSPQNFHLDKPMPASVALAKALSNAGAEVVYLTGRTEFLRQATADQLAAAGLPNIDTEHLLLKPSVDVHTPAYKEGEMARLAGLGHVALFMTEGRRDLAHLQAAAPGPLYVLLDFPIEPWSQAVLPNTPFWRPRQR